MSVDIELEKKVARKWLALQESAAKRGKPFNLTLTTLKSLYKAKRCYYTGVSLSRSYTMATDSLTIDCVDPRKGYVIGNVVACARVINSLKGSLTPEQLQLLSEKVTNKVNSK